MYIMIATNTTIYSTNSNAGGSYLMESKEEIFTNLIAQYLPAFRGTAIRILANPDDADDAVQEALSIAWTDYSVFRRKSTLYTWVTGILIHRCYKIRESRIKHSSVPLDDSVESIPDTASDDSAALERLERLQSAIGKLPPLYRDAVVIGCLSGLPGKDAAERLQCTPNTLYQRINTAKMKLKAAMKGDQL